MDEPMDDIAFEAAQEYVEGMAAVWAEIAAVTEAELAARGIHPVTVAHGEASTDEDVTLVYTSLHRLADRCGTLAGFRGESDYATFLFAGPGADTAADTFIARALEIAPGWWRVTATALPA